MKSVTELAMKILVSFAGYLNAIQTAHRVSLGVIGKNQACLKHTSNRLAFQNKRTLTPLINSHWVSVTLYSNDLPNVIALDDIDIV